VEQLLTDLYNDRSRRWSQYEGVPPCSIFDRCSTNYVNLPRSPCDIMKRFRGEIHENMNAFIVAFKQSGRGSFDEWEYERWPLPQFINSFHNGLLMYFVGMHLYRAQLCFGGGLPDHHLFPRTKRARFVTRLTRTSAIPQQLCFIPQHLAFPERKRAVLGKERLTSRITHLR
jgi:hypothetical protein